jgi:hypothetical protein
MAKLQHADLTPETFFLALFFFQFDGQSAGSPQIYVLCGGAHQFRKVPAVLLQPTFMPMLAHHSRRTRVLAPAKERTRQKVFEARGGI